MLDNERPRHAPRSQALIDTLALRYWTDRAHALPSAKTAKRELRLIQEWWEGKTVADITPDAQRRFRQHLAELGTGPGGIDRILSTLRAALNHARKNEEVESVPFISGFRPAEELRSREPKGRPLSLDELARLIDAAQSRHMLMYLMLAIGTLARPAAVLDMTAGQYDAEHGVLTLNPPGRIQNKKWRPVIPVAAALTPWLTETAEKKTGRFVTYRGKPVTSILAAFRVARETAGLDARVTPYSIRHTMARELRKAGVPGDQISIFLGHLPQGAAATTAVYAPYEPGYLADAAAAIDAVMQRLGTMTKASQQPPQAGGDAPTVMTAPTGKAIRRGIGEEKRAEVRRLILEGVPHAQVKAITGVSDGTISVIRQALKAEALVLRATR
ncbi:tyrosine-type recombinase/integrase [Azospirillum picis]|uniref:Integrase n=1 Tax=Azospirillum picis TaxID=488438 RepID=A0ABU0MEL3_9PROT|nr:tyrosine-type recombinase/integrase [Azospirillum picis]MBP2297991.1 integrase [Azospirillum picis]MDQ0531829.1 integrase [Azospirillum picis]